MDIYAPTDTGPWPLVVVVPGANMAPDSIKTYIDDFALLVADRGSVVMTAEWRQSGSDAQEGISDIACAVGVARRKGPLYGADPERVVLVGHSLGVRPMVGTGFTVSPATPDPTSCDPTSGSLRPEAVMVIAGLYDLEGVASLASTVASQERIPVVIAQGGADDASHVEAARALVEVLEDAGWGSTLLEVPSADHPGILYEPATLDAVMALATAP
jgi:acetyl esterase/lipase